MTRTRHATIVLLLAALSAAQATAWAQEHRPGDGPMSRPRPTTVAPSGAPRADMAPQSGRSVSEAVRWVRRTYPSSQILGVEQVPFEGRHITRVKYVDDQGRVRTVDDPGPSRDGRPRGRRDSREDTNDT